MSIGEMIENISADKDNDSTSLIIYAGNDSNEILNFFLESVQDNFLLSEDEFNGEYPDDTPTKYLISIQKVKS